MARRGLARIGDVVRPVAVSSDRPRFDYVILTTRSPLLSSPASPCAVRGPPRIVVRVKETIVERGGYRLRVCSRGPADGPHAIVLPGMGATSRALAPQIRTLRALGYATHVIDLPGFGLAPALRREDARFSQLADLVLATADAIGVRRAVLVGHSLGGGIALYAALHRPAFRPGLILPAAPAPGPSPLWIYKLFCVPVLGRALLRPYRHGNRAYLRRFLLGSARRDDEHFVDALLRQDTCSPAKTLSMP